MSWQSSFEEYKFVTAYHRLPEQVHSDLKRRIEILANLFGNAGWIDGHLGYLAEIIVEDTVRLFGKQGTNNP